MKKIIIASIATLALATASIAGAPPQCNGCHGADGSRINGVPGKAPNMLSKADIVTALKEYKAGKRNKYGKAMMMGAAKGLSDAQINDVAQAWGK